MDQPESSAWHTRSVEDVFRTLSSCEDGLSATEAEVRLRHDGDLKETFNCSDKTGTLIENQMTLTTLWVGGQLLHGTGVGFETTGHSDRRLAHAALRRGDSPSAGIARCARGTGTFPTSRVSKSCKNRKWGVVHWGPQVHARVGPPSEEATMNPLAVPYLRAVLDTQFSGPAVLFTTIDGFPLTGRTKQLDEILPAAELLQRRGIPLVLCSRRTRREIEARSGRLGSDSPFIYENGGGVRVPQGHFPFPIEGEVDGGEIIIPLGTPYPHLRSALRDLRRELRVSATGFGDLSAAGIASLAGLSIGEADLARRREFDEPFAFDDPREPRAAEFLRAIEARGLRWTRGRFFHIHGDNDQSRAVRLLTGLYRRVWPTLRTVAIWDVLHDPSLLQTIDVPVLLKLDDAGSAEGASAPATGRVGDPASEGWNRTVLEIFGKRGFPRTGGQEK